MSFSCWSGRCCAFHCSRIAATPEGSERYVARTVRITVTRTNENNPEIARVVFNDLPNVEADTFNGLLVDYVERRDGQVIVRGLRAVSDFEFEFQMALMNRRLNGKIETVFMMPAEQYSYISSRLIKEVFALGGRVHGLVPDMVEDRLRQKVNKR